MPTVGRARSIGQCWVGRSGSDRAARPGRDLEASHQCQPVQARNGPRVDEYVTEAVLAKLEERQAAAPEAASWPGAPELERVQQKLSMLTRQWQEDRISDALYFSNVEKLEGRIRELTKERNRHAAAAQRAVADVADVRRRWFTPPEDGGLELSEKRAYIREALYAVIVSPSGRGVGSHGRFNPNLLDLVWRT